MNTLTVFACALEGILYFGVPLQAFCAPTVRKVETVAIGVIYLLIRTRGFRRTFGFALDGVHDQC